MHTYQRSGTIPALGGIVVSVMGTIVAAVAAVVYTYATVYIPIIYLNVLITLAFGAIIGYGVGKAAVWGKVRNLWFLVVAAVLCGLIGYYMEWVTTLYIFVGPKIGINAFSPLNILAIVVALYQEGSWGLFGAQPVTGIFLAIIWLIELGIILVTSVFTATAVGGLQPFCETCDTWTETEEGLNRLQPGGGDDLWDKVLAGDFIPLDSLVRASGSEHAYIRFDVASCPHCTESEYLTINVVQITVDDKGNDKENLTQLVEHALVTREHIDFLRTCGQAEPTPEQTLNDLSKVDLSEKTKPVDSDNDEPQADDFDFSNPDYS